MDMICTNCKEKISEDKEACKYCGTTLKSMMWEDADEEYDMSWQGLPRTTRFGMLGFAVLLVLFIGLFAIFGWVGGCPEATP